MLKTRLITFLLLTSSPAFAFINIGSVRQIPGDGFVGSSGAQMSGQDGNTQKFSLRGNTLGVFRWDRDEFLFLGDYRYGTSDNRKDTNHGHGHIRYTFFHREPIAYEIFYQSEFDESKNLNSRNLSGGNVRRRVLQNDRQVLHVGVGGFYEYEDFSHATDQDGIRGNVYFSYNYKITPTLASATTCYYQPLIKDLGEYRVRLQTGLDIKVKERLIFDIDFNLVQDTALPSGAEPTDLDYLFGFTVLY